MGILKNYGLPACLGVGLLLLLTGSPSFAFGTINNKSQSAEHEKITRLAFECIEIAPNETCHKIEPLTLDRLAGTSREARWSQPFRKWGSFGAVGYPDNPVNGLILTEAAHCDNGDFLSEMYWDGPYRQSAEQAKTRVEACRAWMKHHLDMAIKIADQIVTPDNKIDAAEVRLTRNCIRQIERFTSAKCNVLKHFGIMLHASQDFFSHSNCTDLPDAEKQVDRDNPPGLWQLGSEFKDSDCMGWVSLSASSSEVQYPKGLMTGSFVMRRFGKNSRVRHDELNSDTGYIPASSLLVANLGEADWAGTTPRGGYSDNFGRAVRAAAFDSRRKLDAFRLALIEEFGGARGDMMFCAIIHDAPQDRCPSTSAEG